MSETKDEKLLAGSTAKAPALTDSMPNLKDGDESDAMLLAMILSPLATLLARNKAVLGKAIYDSQPCAVIILKGVRRVGNEFVFVGKVADEETSPD